MTTMNETFATHHHHRTRMVVVENVTKPSTPGDLLVSRHQRGALFTARVAKQSQPTTTTTTTNTTTTTMPNPATTFQPVEPEGVDDDDFALEDLEEASQMHVDSFDEHELNYHDEYEDHNEENNTNIRITVSTGDDKVQVVSDSSERNENDYHDDDEEQYHEESPSHTVDPDLSYGSRTGMETPPVPQRPTMVQSQSPVLSESGGSSAFTPTKAHSLSPYTRVPVPAGTGGGGRIGPPPSPPSPSARIVQQMATAGTAGETILTPVATKPPRPGVAQSTTSNPSTQPPHTTIMSTTTTPPGIPKARITVQTSTPRYTRNPPPVSPSSSTRPIAATPVASNLGELLGASVAQLGKGHHHHHPPPTLDDTPVVSNSRKALVTPDSSPARDTSLVDNEQHETDSDWSKSAVDQMTNAVDALARIGHSFLQGPVPANHPAPASQQSLSTPGHAPEPLQESTQPSPTPLHPPTIQHPQGHFHPPLHQYTPALHPNPSTDAAPGQAPLQSHPNNHNSSNNNNMSALPPRGPPSQTGMVGQPVMGGPPVPPQRPPPEGSATESALSDALDKMNLDDRSSELEDQQSSGPQNGFLLQSSLLQNSAFQQQQQHLHPSIQQQQQQQQPGDGDTRSAYGLSQSQTGTEHISNQRLPRPTSAQIAASYGSRGPAESNKNKSAQHYKKPGKGQDITPMMRMRNKDLVTNDHQSVNSNDVISRSQSLVSQSVQSQSIQSHSVQSYKSAASQMTEEEFHAMKQRKWREKKKLADETRAREKERLEGTRKKKSRGRAKRKRLDVEGITNLGACQSGLQNILSNILEGSCGQMEEDGSDSEDDEESTIGESTQASEDYTRGSSIQSSRNPPDSPSRMSSKISNAYTEEESLEQQDATTDGGTITTDGSRTEDSGGNDNHSEDQQSVPHHKIDMEKFKDKAFIKKFTSDISSKGIRFFYHKANNGTLANPARVMVRLNLGRQDSNGKFSEPHLMVSSEGGEFELIFDIFDIRSLEKASAMKLKAYPLSLPGNSILIRLSEGDHVLEAPDEEAAARFVHGMRWLIARLSFNLIIGNASVSCELLESVEAPPDEMQEERAMNDVSNFLADKTTQFVSI